MTDTEIADLEYRAIRNSDLKTKAKFFISTAIVVSGVVLACRTGVAVTILSFVVIYLGIIRGLIFVRARIKDNT